MRTPWVLLGLAMVAIGGMNVTPPATALQLAESDAAGKPEPRMTPDKELDKHHGSSGMDPDHMGSQARPMPGEKEEGGAGAPAPRATKGF